MDIQQSDRENTPQGDPGQGVGRGNLSDRMRAVYPPVDPIFGPVAVANSKLVHDGADLIDDLLALAYQYLSDLRYPPTGDSLKRRIEQAERTIAKARGE